ncbi:MAG: hypothetical protein ACE5OR_04990 [bacterium]
MNEQMSNSCKEPGEKLRELTKDLKRDSTVGTVAGILSLTITAIFASVPLVRSVAASAITGAGGVTIVALLLRDKLKKQKEMEQLRHDHRAIGG